MVRSLFSTGQRIISKQSSSILSAALVITGASLLSAILGLIRNRLLVSQFFASVPLREQLDAYWVAFRIPEMVFQLLVIGALSAAFIPVYSRIKEKSSEQANAMMAASLNLVLLIFFVLSVVIFIFAEPLNNLITSNNFSGHQVALAASLTRVMLVAQLFFAVSNFMTGMIQAHHRFFIPAISPLAYNLGIIIGIWLFTPIVGIYGPAIGVVIGALLHLLIQLPLAFRLGFKPSRELGWRNTGVREMIRLMPPRTLAISVDQIELFASVYFTTALPAGSLTMLNLAQQLMNAPTRVFSVPIGQASLPFLSQEAARHQLTAFRQTLTQTFNQVLFLSFPASVLILVLRIPLVRLAYGAAEFPWSATLLTGKLVAIFALAVFAYGGIHVLTRAYYALSDTRTPFIIALSSVLLSICLMVLNAKFLNFGVLGIGAALAGASVIQFSLLLWRLWHHYHLIDGKLLFQSQIRIVGATVFMGLALWIPMRLLDTWVFDTTRTLPLIGLTALVSLIGGGVYLLLASLLRIPELAAFLSLFKKLGAWRNTLEESDEVIESASHTEEVKPW
jgi:putative peptidoglycan lipid II flippase